MKEDGFTESHCTLFSHIIPGIEYEEVLAAVDNFKRFFQGK